MKIEIIDFGLDDVCKIPERKRPDGDCGYDCYSRVDAVVPAHGTAKIPLGFGMKIPEGLTAYMHNRGGNFLKGLNYMLPTRDSRAKVQLFSLTRAYAIYAKPTFNTD